MVTTDRERGLCQSSAFLNKLILSPNRPKTLIVIIGKNAEYRNPIISLADNLSIPIIENCWVFWGYYMSYSRQITRMGGEMWAMTSNKVP